MNASAVGGDGHILFAIDSISNRIGVQGIVQASLPEHLAGILIQCLEPPIYRTNKQQSRCRGEIGGSLRSGLTLAPDYFPGFEINGLDDTVAAIG